MNKFDTIRLAWDNVRANLLRSFLTLLIIALGVMALVGILTAIDGIIYSMSSNFGYLGANSFSIESISGNFRRHGGGEREQVSPPLNYNQALDFKDRFIEKGIVTISYGCTGSATVKHMNKKTSPSVRVRGIDENYFKVTGYDIQCGRSFTPHEAESGNANAIIGMDLVKKLFEDVPEKAIGKEISVDEKKYTVIGVLKSKGSAMNDGADRRVFIPLLKAKIDYAPADADYDIAVAAIDINQVDQLTAEATGEMRGVRGLRAYEENDFEIHKSDGIVEFLKRTP